MLVYPLSILRCVFFSWSLISSCCGSVVPVMGMHETGNCKPRLLRVLLNQAEHSNRTKTVAHHIIQYMCVIKDNYPLYFSAHLNANGAVDNDKEATGESVGRFFFLNSQFQCVYAKQQQQKQRSKCDEIIRHKSVFDTVAKRICICVRAFHAEKVHLTQM